MPSKDAREAKIAVHERVKAYSQAYGISVLGLRFARFIRAKFTRVLQTKIELEECSYEDNFGKERGTAPKGFWSRVLEQHLQKNHPKMLIWGLFRPHKILHY